MIPGNRKERKKREVSPSGTIIPPHDKRGMKHHAYGTCICPTPYPHPSSIYSIQRTRKIQRIVPDKRSATFHQFTLISLITLHDSRKWFKGFVRPPRLPCSILSVWEPAPDPLIRISDESSRSNGKRIQHDSSEGGYSLEQKKDTNEETGRWGTAPEV